MHPWTLTMSCPQCGGRLEPINQARHADPRSGICRMVVTVVRCTGDCSRQWEVEVVMSQHRVTVGSGRAA